MDLESSIINTITIHPIDFVNGSMQTVEGEYIISCIETNYIEYFIVEESILDMLWLYRYCRMYSNFDTIHSLMQTCSVSYEW